MPIKKENENDETIKRKIKFINNLRFMISSLLRLLDDLAKGLHKDKWQKCKFGLKYVASKESILTFKCVGRGESYEKKFQEDLTKGFEEIYKLCD